MKEIPFQAELVKEIKRRFPGVMVLRNDPSYFQGVPDLLILYETHWAAIECKRSKNSPKRPNQEYYVNLLNDMSFARFVYPENKEEVLNALQRSFHIDR